ncbi:unnamed protein product, partial [Ixodes pacificus]
PVLSRKDGVFSVWCCGSRSSQSSAFVRSPLRSRKRMCAKFDQVCLSKQTKQVVGSRCSQSVLSTVAVCRSVSELTGVIEPLASVSKPRPCMILYVYFMAGAHAGYYVKLSHGTRTVKQIYIVLMGRGKG